MSEFLVACMIMVAAGAAVRAWQAWQDRRIAKAIQVRTADLSAPTDCELED